MKFKLFLFVILAAACCFGQSAPQFNHSTGLFTWSIVQDATQAMYGCSTNNYNAEGQCTGSMGWYYHTAEARISVTNLRTGVTTSSGNSIYAGKAVASISVPALDGDKFSYTTTSRVWCPIALVWSGWYNLPGYFELAYTKVSITGQGTGCVSDPINKTIICNVPVGNWCDATTTPPDSDYTGTSIRDVVAPFYYTESLCWSLTGHYPWGCTHGISVPVEDTSLGHCTHHL